MESLNVGLIRGRHPLPVDEYIFDSVENVHDYDTIRNHILDFLDKRVGIGQTSGQGANQNDSTDVQIFRGNRKLNVYVTGLTSVTAALVSACIRNGVELTLLHFDTESKAYKEQHV